MRKIIYILVLLPLTIFGQGTADSYVHIFGKSTYYQRDIIRYPTKQLGIKENIDIMKKDTLLQYLYRFNLNDTFNLKSKDLHYIKGTLRFKIKHNSKKIDEYFNDLAVNSENNDTLNGFYRVYNSNSDYILGYYWKGSPYFYSYNNVFEYYSNEKLVKRRFFIHTNPYINDDYFYSRLSILEDYIPLAKNKWRREVRTYPDEKLLVEDTVYYNKKRGYYFDGIQHVYTTGENGEMRLHKTHTFKKGKLVAAKTHYYNNYYYGSPYYYEYKTVSTDLTNKNYKTVVETRDSSGILYSRDIYVNVTKRNDNCSDFIIDYEYLNEGKQCFVRDGCQYNLDKSYSEDNEEILCFEKGILLSIKKNIAYKYYYLSDSLTLKIYDSDPEISSTKEIIDYKKQKGIKEYYIPPNDFTEKKDQLLLRITTIYEDCETPSEYVEYKTYESNKCDKEQQPDNKVRYKELREYYGRHRNVIYKCSHIEYNN